MPARYGAQCPPRLEKTKKEKQPCYFLIASIWPDVTQSRSSAEVGFRSAFLAMRLATQIQLIWFRSGLLSSSSARTLDTND